MKRIFLSDNRPLHQALALAFEEQLEIVESEDQLFEALKTDTAPLVILDAQYAQRSGYAICEDIKSGASKDARVHLLSNEVSIGIDEKASYAGVDRVFRVPRELTEILNYE